MENTGWEAEKWARCAAAKKGGAEAEEKVIINLSNHQHNTDFVGRYVLSP